MSSICEPDVEGDRPGFRELLSVQRVLFQNVVGDTLCEEDQNHAYSDTIEASEMNEAGFSVAVRDERTRMRVVAMAVNTGQSVWYQ